MNSWCQICYTDIKRYLICSRTSSRCWWRCWQCRYLRYQLIEGLMVWSLIDSSISLVHVDVKQGPEAGAMRSTRPLGFRAAGDPKRGAATPGGGSRCWHLYIRAAPMCFFAGGEGSKMSHRAPRAAEDGVGAAAATLRGGKQPRVRRVEAPRRIVRAPQRPPRSRALGGLTCCHVFPGGCGGVSRVSYLFARPSQLLVRGPAGGAVPAARHPGRVIPMWTAARNQTAAVSSPLLTS